MNLFSTPAARVRAALDISTRALAPARPALTLIATWLGIIAAVALNVYVATFSYAGANMYVEATLAGAVVTVLSWPATAAATAAPAVPEQGFWKRFGVWWLRLLMTSAERVVVLLKYSWFIAMFLGILMALRGAPGAWAWLPAGFLLFWVALWLSGRGSAAREAEAEAAKPAPKPKKRKKR